MADTLVSNLLHSLSDEANAIWGPYWSDENTAIIVLIDEGRHISFARTIDAGGSWAITEIEAVVSVQVAVWYDRETPGDSGTLLHIAYIDNTNVGVNYVNVDVADAAVGTIRVVDNTITPHNTFNLNRVAITKTVSGNIILALSTQNEIKCYKSSNLFATAATSIADVYETSTEEDWCLLFPANTGDDNDACAVFWDRDANQISVKMYDDSANSWAETILSSSLVDNAIHMNMDGAVRLSDSHLLVAAIQDPDSAAADLLTWDLTVDSIASPTVTAKTNIFTNQDTSFQVAVFIDQTSDDVYIAYLKGTIGPTFVNVVFHISDDGMGSWGGEQAYSENADVDLNAVCSGRTVTAAGGRYQPVFYDDDLTDIFVNLVNDIDFALPVDTFLDIPSVVLTTNVQRLPDKSIGY